VNNYYVTVTIIRCVYIVEKHEGHPNENKQKLLLLSLLQQGSQPLSLSFWQTFKGRQRSGKALYYKKGRLQVLWLGGVDRCWRQLNKSRASYMIG
jgi:hypothetical protein